VKCDGSYRGGKKALAHSFRGKLSKKGGKNNVGKPRHKLGEHQRPNSKKGWKTALNKIKTRFYSNWGGKKSNYFGKKTGVKGGGGKKLQKGSPTLKVGFKLLPIGTEGKNR